MTDMNNELEKIIPVDDPITVGCPRCWNPITKANMIGEYIVYNCLICGWQTPKSTFFKINQIKDKG